MKKKFTFTRIITNEVLPATWTRCDGKIAGGLNWRPIKDSDPKDKSE